MLNIEQFRYGDNLAYLLYGRTEAMAVDGGAWQEILAFLRQYNLTLRYVTNTHRHYDHTPGDDHLLKKTKAIFLDCTTLADNEEILIDGESVVVYRTPGHSTDSICFHTGHNLITGDTLFNGTIGNNFSGDLKGFFNSILRLMALPDETRVFGGMTTSAIRWPLQGIWSRKTRTLNTSGNPAIRIFSTRRLQKNGKLILIYDSTKNLL